MKYYVRWTTKQGNYIDKPFKTILEAKNYINKIVYGKYCDRRRIATNIGS